MGNAYRIFILLSLMLEKCYKTRMKTFIRYAKENDREKIERRREREGNVEGEI